MMTNRSTELSSRDRQTKSCTKQQIPSESTNEGCPVREESGTTCGETDSFNVFQDFRKIYEDCVKRLEGSPDGTALLRKLTSFRKIVDDLWEQNSMLVETVEELEQEATTHVTNLQNKLDKSCQKELHCILKAKERELQGLAKDLCEKNELLQKYCCRIEQLEKQIIAKNNKCKDLVKRLQCVAGREDDVRDDDFDECDEAALDKMLNCCVTDLENQRNLLTQKSQDADLRLRVMASERQKLIVERNEMGSKLQGVACENERLKKEEARHRISHAEKEELRKMVDQLKSEKGELLVKINGLQESIKEMNVNFKETRWALTSEVAEKHDQVQELRKCVGALENELFQANQKMQIKDDVAKELRKELENSKKSLANQSDHQSKKAVREHSPPTQLTGGIKPTEKRVNEDELKLDIRIFSLNDSSDKCKLSSKKPDKTNNAGCRSVDVQTDTLDGCFSASPGTLKKRNVSTQHRTRVQKLPRSFGTLTVTPWSGTSGQTIANDDIDIEYVQDNKKNLKGVFTVPFSSI